MEDFKEIYREEDTLVERERAEEIRVPDPVPYTPGDVVLRALIAPSDERADRWANHPYPFVDRPA